MKYIKGALSFAAAIIMTVAALFYEQRWAFNICVFYSSLSAVSYLVASFKPPQELLQSYRDGKHLPRWLDIFLYSLLVCLWASFAHWWLATCWVLIASGDMSIREKAKLRHELPT